MISPETAKASPGERKRGPQNVERFGGQFDPSLNPFSCDSHRTGPNLKALGVGLNECEAELNGCQPLACDHAMRDKLRALGVMRFAGNAADPFDALCSEPVILLPSRRFEFAKYLRDQAGHRPAVIGPARDRNGDLIDLFAVDPSTGQTATWRNRVALLGGENVLRSRPRFEVPLAVHESALDWLRADREGVAIIDPRRAADWLDGFTLAAATAVQGEQLRQELTRPPPPIVIRRAPL